MKATDAFPSKFLSASDLEGNELTVKITHIDADEIGGKKKYICFFAGQKKGLVLNKTNFNSITRISGYDDTDDWTGVIVSLYEAMVDFQGDQVPAIRIKPPQKVAAPQRAVARPSSAEMEPPRPARRAPPPDDIPDDNLDDFRR